MVINTNKTSRVECTYLFVLFLLHLLVAFSSLVDLVGDSLSLQGYATMQYYQHCNYTMHSFTIINTSIQLRYSNNFSKRLGTLKKNNFNGLAF